MNKQKKFNQQNSKLILEELEERRLFSGGIEGLISTSLDSDEQAIYADLDTSKTQTDSTRDETSASVAEEQTQEIVFVDEGVDNYQQLVDDLRNNADTNRNIEVVVLDRDQDGIEQISAVLQDRDDLDAVHIISHGSDGSVELGNTSLDAYTLEQNNQNIALWANAFAETGDILIYGCNLAATDIGQSLINELSELTLTDVVASDDLTGQADLGGDWVLEYSIGEVETAVAVSAEAQGAWQALLATETVRENFDTASYTNNDGTQSWSTGWVETDDGGGGASGGEIYVDGTDLRIRVRTDGDNIYREADLSGATAATLTFDVTDNRLVNSDILRLQVSNDGGGNWVTLKDFTTADPNVSSESFDITGSIAANTRVRFLVVGDGDDRIHIDNVQIQYTTGGNQAPVITSEGGGATANINVVENTTAVTTVTATDPDLDTPTFSITGGADAALFSIDLNSGVLTFISAPNFESPADANTDNVYEVNVQTDDGNSGTDTQALSVTVTNILELNVTNTDATGTGSLHEAIINANANIGVTDTITFNIGGGGAQTIIVDAAGLPAITDSIILDATIQPGYSGTPLITLDGSATGAGINGITLNTNDSTVKGLIVHSFGGEGIEIDGSTGFGDNNIIQNNCIGINAAENVAGVANNGILISDGASGNQIGGTGASDGNIIAGNGLSGISIQQNSDNNIVEGNLIGLEPDGTTSAGNSTQGILIQLASDGNRIGGTTAGAGNVISANAQDGIYIDGTTDATYTTVVTNTLIQGNFIGTNAAGTAAMGNGDEGISVQNNASGTTIGGSTATARNIISDSSRHGVLIQSGAVNSIIRGNYIGTDVTGTVDLGNGSSGTGSGVLFNSAGNNNLIGGVSAGEGNIIAYSGDNGVEIRGTSTAGQILGNAIYANNGIGIDLNNDGVTANDSGDSDTGANNLQNFPLLTSAVSDGSTTITINGALNTDGLNQDYRIEFFASNTSNGTGYGAAERYLGFVTVTTDGSGNAVINAALSANVAVGEYITATTTVDLGAGNYGDTSEFSLSTNTTSDNNAPTVVDSTVSTNKDVPYVFSAVDFGYNDTDGDPIDKAQITSLPTVGSLKLNGVAVILNQEITKADIDAGLLTFTPVADANGIGYDNFEYRVHDGTEYSAWATNTVHINTTFDNNADGFTYADITNASWANGAYDGAGGSNGGGLRIDLG